MPGGFYHVMLRGNGGQDIFFDDEDRSHFYLLLQEGISRYGHRIHAFCCMTNHVHLLIQVSEVPLSKIMQNISFRFTLWINKRQVINRWFSQTDREDSGRASLEAGRLYEITMEMYESGGNGNVRLSWSADSLAREVVPETHSQQDPKHAESSGQSRRQGEVAEESGAVP